MATQIQANTQSYLGRRVLQANGIFSAIGGAIFTLAAGPIADFTGLPSPLALVIGLGVLAYAAALFATAARSPIPRRLMLAAALLDTIWVVGSVLLLVSGWLPLTEAGRGLVIVLAVIVAGFALAEFYTWERMA